MLLAIAATEIEMNPFQDQCRRFADDPATLVSGVGLLESAVRLTRFLEKHHMNIHSVVNFGVGGAYIRNPSERAVGVLDICLASREILGDYGICCGLTVEPFADPVLGGPTSFYLDRTLLADAQKRLAAHRLDFHSGSFVTVNGASGSVARGASLRDRHDAICENMEGGAIARVCEEFSLPLLEVRIISNLVEDRPGSPWRLHEACEKAARVAALLVREMRERS